MRLLCVFGTRPEAVKLAPVLLALRQELLVETRICVTGQHRALLDGVLDFFGLVPDRDLDLMQAAQSPSELLARAIDALDRVVAQERPDRVIVHGDTTTALAAAFAAFHRRIPVAHVEAGLRTYQPSAPFPEELNRRAVALAADLHFAPTLAARANLEGERLHGEVFVTGNSGIDALHRVVERLQDERYRADVDADLPDLGSERLALLTCHRRESFGEPLRGICTAAAELGRRGFSVVLPLHPNPALQAPAKAELAGRLNIRLLPPLGLPAFVRTMQRADLILTDSGGVQEEAVALGKPVLVLRGASERPEGVAAGAARLVGTDAGSIVAAAFDQRPFYVGRDLYGDGRAAGRIVDGLLGRAVDEFCSEPPVTEAAE